MKIGFGCLCGGWGLSEKICRLREGVAFYHASILTQPDDVSICFNLYPSLLSIRLSYNCRLPINYNCRSLASTYENHSISMMDFWYKTEFSGSKERQNKRWALTAPL